MEQDFKSIGEETTFPEDVPRMEQVYPVMNLLVQDVGFRLRQAGQGARKITVKLRLANFITLTRSKTLDQAVQADQKIYQTAVELIKAMNPIGPFRLLGLQLSNLESSSWLCQLSLWDDGGGRREAELHRVVDGLRGKYGRPVLFRAAGLTAGRDRAGRKAKR